MYSGILASGIELVAGGGWWVVGALVPAAGPKRNDYLESYAKYYA